MKALISLFAVGILSLFALIGTTVIGLDYFFGVLIPYAAFLLFAGGVIYRILLWGRIPVPFRIPTTCGQQKSLHWIKESKIENPSTTTGVIIRMLLEVLFFRSLFRNTKTDLTEGKLIHNSDKWLWLGGLIFHWTFLIVVLRHIRFFAEPTPFFVSLLERLDGFLQIGVPGLYITGVLLLAAVTYLFIRRVLLPQVRYISLPSDYFPLFLIIGVALSGIFMRYYTKIDVVSVKSLMMGLVTLSPKVPEGIGSLFYVHLFLVSVLFAYFPFSKLMHLGGVFLSPTRNMANNNRMVRYVNPWNYPVKVHTYDEYENDYRDVMKKFGVPVDKE